MGSYAPNLNLYVPAANEVGWGNLMNANLTLIDTLLGYLTEGVIKDDDGCLWIVRNAYYDDSLWWRTNEAAKSLAIKLENTTNTVQLFSANAGTGSITWVAGIKFDQTTNTISNLTSIDELIQTAPTQIVIRRCEASDVVQYCDPTEYHNGSYTGTILEKTINAPYTSPSSVRIKIKIKQDGCIITHCAFTKNGVTLHTLSSLTPTEYTEYTYDTHFNSGDVIGVAISGDSNYQYIKDFTLCATPIIETKTLNETW